MSFATPSSPVLLPPPAGAEAVRSLVAADGAQDPRWPPQGPVHLLDPGDFLAALPAMLGFVPEDSVVLVLVVADPNHPHRTLVDAVARYDIRDGPRRNSPRSIARTAAEVGVCPETVGAFVIIVDAAVAEPAAAEWIGQLVAGLNRRLSAKGVPVQHGWVMGAMRPGQPWWSLFDPGCCGRLPDPATSVVTVRTVADGRPVRRDRSEVVAAVAPDGSLCRGVARHLPEAQSRMAKQLAARGPAHHYRLCIEKIFWQVSCIESRYDPAPQELAAVAVMLRDRVVRDIVFALADTVHAAAAEELWTALARGTRGTDRAESATLLAFFAYQRGAGALAGIALQEALRADPDHVLAAELDTALLSGIRANQLRRLVTCGRRIAAEWRIRIPGASAGLGTRPVSIQWEQDP